jgi:hypothetical protein
MTKRIALVYVMALVACESPARESKSQTVDQDTITIDTNHVLVLDQVDFTISTVEVDNSGMLLGLNPEEATCSSPRLVCEEQKVLECVAE